VEKHLPWHEKLRRERKLRGWSQANVAEKISGDPKTVRRWELGKAFPSPYFRQKLIVLFERSAEELGLTPDSTVGSRDVKALPLSTRWREDWGEAPYVESFYGREGELAKGEQWIIRDRCRIVTVLGIGGIGKTTFATMLAKKVKDTFDYVIWRSLQDAPTVERILESLLQFTSSQQLVRLPEEMDARLSLLITFLQEHRSLLILDNVESVLQVGSRAGLYSEKYEGYGRLFQRFGEVPHQSCLILTSREKPREIVRMEGNESFVRSLPLSGLQQANGQKLLRDKNLSGSAESWATLIRLYAGNPLALKLASELIQTVFGGDIASFLQEGEAVFGDIYDLLDQQFHRLSKLEQEIMYWLAIEREAAPLLEIRANLNLPRPGGIFIEALDSLQRRFMIENDGQGCFTLQPVIMEYATERLVRQAHKEIETEAISLLGSHALIKAQVKDYVRDSQVRFILAPVVEHLLATFGKANSEKKLKNILAALQTTPAQASSYAAGNILNMLVQLQVNLHGADFSHLTVRQAYLQGIALPEVNFAHANLATSVFSDTFSNVLCAATSPDGNLLAAGTTTSEVRLWQTGGITPLYTCLGHADGIRSVAFGPDSKILVSGSEDQTIRLWDTDTGLCLNILQGHASLIRSVAFSPNGHTIASGSDDRSVRLWDTDTGLCLNILQGHTLRVRSVVFSPDGKMLASGGDDQTIRLWDVSTGNCLKILQADGHQVRSLAFSPDGKVLACGGDDQTIRLWDTDTGLCSKALQGHTQRVRAVAFTSDGEVLASSSDDSTIRLWDSNTGRCFKTLQGHINRIWSIAFFPDDRLLVSASEDDTMRFWDIHMGQCLKTLQGYSSRLIKSVVFSPDGHTLASGSEDQTLQLWEVTTGRCFKTLRGHTNRIRSVVFSPDGTIIASGSEDQTVRIWDTATGRCVKTLQGHTHLVRSVAFNSNGSVIVSGSHDQTARLWDVSTGECLKILRGHGDLVWTVAFSPAGNLIASGSDDNIIRLWDVTTGQTFNILRGHTHRVWSVAFSPAGNVLASGSDDQTIRLWDTNTGLCLNILEGHALWVRSIAFSPTGNLIASGSHDRTVRLWDVNNGHCLKTLHGHLSCVWSVAFSLDGSTVASSSDDGTIRLWEAGTGTCLNTLRIDRPYERMNITHAIGLTEAQKTSLQILGAIDD